MRRSLLLALVCLATPLAAQTPGQCAPGTANGRLDASGIDVRVFTTGGVGYGEGFRNGDGYIAPRGSRRSPLFAATLRVAGQIAGDLRVTSGGFYAELWPGPLGADATLPDPTDCSAYDRVYVVSRQDVATYETTGSASDDLAAWPVGLGAPAVRAGGQPVTVTSRAQTLDLAAGERPVLSGTQTAFWVMNDVGGAHTQTGTAPLGVEVRATAFVVASDDPAFDQGLFLRYEILNRGAQSIDAAYAGFFADHDLGNYNDDYAATDTLRGMAFAYNGSITDDQYGVPPAHGIDLLDGLGASVATVNVSGASQTPVLGLPVYRRMQGLWSDGTPVRAVGDGYNQPASFPATRYSYPGDPVTGAFWSNERRVPGGGSQTPANVFVDVASPAFTLAPGASTVVNAAMLFAQGMDRLDSVVRLRAASDAVQAAFDAGTLFPVSAQGTTEAPRASALGAAFPNPVRASFAVPYTLAAPGTVRLRVVDVLGRTVAILADGSAAAGDYEARMDARHLAAGVYAVVLDAGDVRSARTVTVVR